MKPYRWLFSPHLSAIICVCQRLPADISDPLSLWVYMAKTAPRPFGKPRHSSSKIWLRLSDSVSRPPTLSLEPDQQKLTCHTVSTGTGHSSNSDTHFSWHCLMSAGGRWVLTLVTCCPNRRQSRGQQAWQQLSCNIAFLQSMYHCS